MIAWFPILLGCGHDPPSDAPGLVLQAQAVRISMALRGLRPTEAELALVVADPNALHRLIDVWLHDPAFGLTVRDLHAERFDLRADQKIPWPALGPLEGIETGALSRSMNEQPLRLVEQIVTDGLPYTEILTTGATPSDALLAAAYGLPYDPDGPEWQVSSWPDGRPDAGVLASTGLWLRHFSNASGKHRVRAELVSRALLCDAIGATDMPYVPAIDAPDDLAMADILATDPNCVRCHDTLDPLSAVFWPFSLNLPGNRIKDAYREDCAGDTSGACYPVTVWQADPPFSYGDFGLPPPGYYGEPVDDLGDVARLVSQDPRFATCTARTTRAFLAQEDPAAVDPAEVDRLAAVLVDSGWDYRALVRAVVTAPSFLGATGAPVGPLVVRPEAYARLLGSWSGCPIEAEVDPEWGASDLLGEARYGYRVLLGGTDHEDIRRPDHTFDGPRILAIDAAAEMAAGCAVRSGRWLDPTVTEPAAVRSQLVALYAGVLGVRPDPTALAPAEALFAAGLAATDAETAWTWVLRGLFSDPAVVVY